MKKFVVVGSAVALIGGGIFLLGETDNCEKTEFTPPHGDTYVVDVCPGPDGPEVEFVWNKGGAEVDIPAVSL